MLTFLLIIASLVVLIGSADVFVSQASSLAKKFKVDDFLIGLTVVAFGTSLPEMISALFAATAGHTQLLVSSIIGSNLVNISLVLGCVAVFEKFKIKKSDVDINLPLNLAALAGFWAISALLQFYLDWKAGLVMIGLFIALLVLSKNYNHVKSSKGSYAPFNIFWFVVSLIALIISGKICINQTILFADHFHISESILGYFLLSIGTSLPELITTWIAVRKKNDELGIGNILGSNLFNILFVLGASIFIKPIRMNDYISELAILTGITLLAYYFAISGKKYSFNKREGIGLILAYILFVCFQIFKANSR